VYAPYLFSCFGASPEVLVNSVECSTVLHKKFAVQVEQRLQRPFEIVKYTV